MRLAVGSDHAGYYLKDHLLNAMKDWDVSVKDHGCYSLESVDYPDFAEKICRAVLDGEADYGLLICGTGQGMAMTANKIPGIRAAVCGDVFSARATREHNNANVLAIGARVIGSGVAELIVKEFIETPFVGGRHQRRIDLIERIEHRY